MQKPKVLDLFAGCGGFSLGFHLAGFDVIAHAEIDEACCNTLKFNFKPDFLYEDDVQKDNFIEWVNKLPQIDVIIAGPPCQGFSVAGVSWVTRDRKRGLNNLYLIPVATAELLKPRVVVIENVPAVLSSRNISLVALTLFRLRELGYRTYPNPPEVEHSVLEGFYEIGEQIQVKLNEIGVKSKKNLLSDPDGLFKLLENVTKFVNELPTMKSFYTFYNEYWMNLKRTVNRSQVSKTRLDIPKRMFKFLRLNGIDIPQSLLNSVSKEIKNLVNFLQKNGLLLDNLSFGDSSLMKGYVACKLLNIRVELPQRLNSSNEKQLKDHYNDLLTKVQQWGNKIRKSAILKSENYGAPERRHRAFIIAYRDSENYPSPPKPLSISETPLYEVVGDLPKLIPGGGTDLLVSYPPIEEEKLTSYQIKMRKNSPGVANHRARSVIDPFYLLRYAMLYQGANDLSFPFYLQKMKKKQFVDAWKRLDGREPSRVILAHLKKDGNAFVHPLEERTITVREAARIQGFPDQFIFPITDSFSKHFHQIGNAVSVQLAEALANHIGDELGFFIKTNEFHGPSENDLKKRNMILPNLHSDSHNIFRGLRTNESFKYAFREFKEEEANYFMNTIEEFNIGHAQFHRESNTLTFDNFTIRDDDKIEDFSLIPQKNFHGSEISFEILKIKSSSKDLGFLGKWLLKNGRDSWFTFFFPETKWQIQRSITASSVFPPIREYLMMNQSGEFFLKFLGFSYKISRPHYWYGIKKSKNQKSITSLDKFISKPERMKIDKRIVRYKWEKLGTKIFVTLTLWSSGSETIGVRLIVKCNQFNEIFQTGETIISRGVTIPDLMQKDSGIHLEGRIIEFDRVRSNILLFLSHVFLYKSGFVSEEEIAAHWGENWIIEQK